MPDQESTAPEVVSTIPAAKANELFQLIGELLDDSRISRHEGEYRKVGMSATDAYNAGLAVQAGTLRVMLRGLLSDKAGGVNTDAVAWGCAWLRRELDREAGAGE